MNKCADCGVYVEGTTCSHCGQPVGESSETPTLSRDRLTEVEQLWAVRSDESLKEAASALGDYTEVGQRVIRAELERRLILPPELEAQLRSPEDEARDEAEEFLRDGVQIYSVTDDNQTHTELPLLQAALESHGFVCKILNTRIDDVVARLTNDPLKAGLWILPDSRIDEARQILQVFLEPPQESASWACPQCDEDVEGQFSECWNCGFEQPESAV